MYFLYLDDSGFVQNINENHFVLGGVCVHGHKIYWLKKYLDDLAQEILPANPEALEFHASEIHAGKGIWKSISKPKRQEIIRKVLWAIEKEKSNTAAFACAVHKPDYPTKNPVEFAFEDLCSRFEMFLNRTYHLDKQRVKGIIILDKSIHENILQKLAISFQQFGTRWRTLTNLVEVPMFIDSKSSRLIQLADHVAYAVFRRYQALDLKYFDVIQRLFDTDENGVIHGLEHKHHSLSCTCIACLR
jgi:hypothetical protein